MLQSVTIIVEGLVQGVFYRQTTKSKALEAGITGEVRNKSDGTVHIIATGSEAQLEHLIAWCAQGPEQAVVTKIHVEKIPLQHFNSFNVVRGR